ncbi:MAG TPA: hypothetical protein VIA62_17170 [Thermoanaerobaculia bacterium]|jgi:hypothetical protein|nr:hypothetical protein [Thermoanaerobaculia bacterium]
MARNGIPLRWLAAAALLTSLAMPGLRAQALPPEHITDHVDARVAFHRLLGLAGEWNGTAGKESIPATVTYRVSANGTVVTEVLFPGTDHEMMTLYYLQGSDLLATHYCAMGNRPQFKLDLMKSTPKELIFNFDGGAGFNPGKDNHIHNGRIAFKDDGKLESFWSFYWAGEEKSVEDFHLTRAAKTGKASGR